MTRLVLIAAIVAAASSAGADSLSSIIGERATVGLPANLAITAIHLSARQRALDVAPATVDVDFPQSARPGRASVRVRVGKRSMFVPVTFAVLADVAIATRDLAPGEVVTSADLRWERHASAGAATVAVGAQVSAPIAAGEVLDDARLTTPPAIPRGTEVTVAVVRGAIAIGARGHLEQAARVGGPARVRLAAGGYASGTLVRADRVRVEVP